MCREHGLGWDQGYGWGQGYRVMIKGKDHGWGYKGQG